jgi:hypothetical protein
MSVIMVASKIVAAQTIETMSTPITRDQLPVGGHPGSIWINDETNKIYILNPENAIITVLDSKEYSCIKMIDDDVGKSHKNAIEDKIMGYYVDGKLSEDHRQLLKDKIMTHTNECVTTGYSRT